MKRIIDIALPVAQWYERLDWHWLPLTAQLGMAMSLLRTLEGGAIPAFAIEYSIDVDLVKMVWFAWFLIGSGILYKYRNSVGFMIGSSPLAVYVSIGYAGFSLSVNNYIPFFVGFCLVAFIVKVFVTMQNGRIRHE